MTKSGENIEFTAIVSSIRNELIRTSDPERAAKNARFFREGYDAYGVSQEDILSLRDAVLNEWGEKLGLTGILSLGDTLVTSDKYEEKSIAIILLPGFEKDFTRETLDNIGRWLDYAIVNWAHTDIIATTLIPVFYRRGIVSIHDMGSWALAPSRWKRRAYAVSLISLLDSTDDYSGILTSIEPLMTDTERVVNQGTGWLLREAWKRKPEPIESFLLDWKDIAPRVIYQYATEKMAKEDRVRFRREKTGKKK